MIYYFFRTIQILLIACSFTLLTLGCSMIMCAAMQQQSYDMSDIGSTLICSVVCLWLATMVRPTEIDRLHKSLKVKETRANPLGLGKESIDPGFYIDPKYLENLKKMNDGEEIVQLDRHGRRTGGSNK